MRRRAERNGISVHAIAGSSTVLLGMDVKDETRLKGLLGFGIKRIDHTEDESYWLKGFKTFKEKLGKHHPGSLISTRWSPIQGFLWGDYTARPGHEYTYIVTPVYGDPSNITHGTSVQVLVSTEDESCGTHAVYFNRGAAGSQAYARKFGNVPPDVVGKPAFRWLSHGLEEALMRFIDQARKGSSLRAAVYEFNYLPVLECFKAAIDRGVDVRIIFDDKKGGPGEANRKALKAAGISTKYLIPRQANPGYISHNKFIILLDKGKPVQVWTGSTNITEGGIFGHSNVGHIVRDERVAKAYLDYWEILSGDPQAKNLRAWNDINTPLPPDDVPPQSITPIFSSRGSMNALYWYAKRMQDAGTSVFLTAAFGLSQQFQEVLSHDMPYLRYILLDKPGKGLQMVSRDQDTRISIGGILDENALDKWMHSRWEAEALTGLNKHVQFIHTKYMIVDALGDDPLLITGSANFSKNSTINNDENMMIIHGNTRVVDLYLGEFMRLFDHFKIRGTKVGASAKKRTGKAMSAYLVPNDSWLAPYYTKDDPKQKERYLFR